MRQMIKRIVQLVFGTVFAFMLITPKAGYKALAETVSDNGLHSNSFDTTSIAEDLADVNFAEWQTLQTTEPQLVRFTEYCYSDNLSVRSQNYGLYVYVYNPTGKAISGSLDANKIRMATRYNETGYPSVYEDLALKLCGSTGGNYSGLFYKFRIVGNRMSKVVSSEKELSRVLKARLYDVASISLYQAGTGTSLGGNVASVATDGIEAQSITVGKQYKFTGFAKGCDTTTVTSGTLVCESNENLTVELNVHHTNWRSDAPAYGLFDYQEVNSVYFNVLERLFENYGNLTAVKAEWNEYKTKPMFVPCWLSASSGNEQDQAHVESAYNALYAYIGRNIGRSNIALPYWVFWDVSVAEHLDVDYNVRGIYNDLVYAYDDYDESGGLSKFWNDYRLKDAQNLNQLDWLFPAREYNNFEGKTLFVSAEEVEAYMQNYTATYGGNLVGEVGQERYSATLFESSIDAERIGLLDAVKDGTNPNAKSGKITMEFSVDAGEDLLSYDLEDLSFFDKFFNAELNPTGSAVNVGEYKYIKEITDADFQGTDWQVMANDLLINDEDQNMWDEFQTTYQQSQDSSNPQRTILLRFANTKYHASTAHFDHYVNTWGQTDYHTADANGFVAQESVFLNFNIISLTFTNDENVETVVAVSRNPINIINGIDDRGTMAEATSGLDIGGDGLGLFDKIFAIIAGVILIVVAVWLIRKLFGSGKTKVNVTVNTSDYVKKKGKK